MFAEGEPPVPRTLMRVGELGALLGGQRGDEVHHLAGQDPGRDRAGPHPVGVEPGATQFVGHPHVQGQGRDAGLAGRLQQGGHPQQQTQGVVVRFEPDAHVFTACVGLSVNKRLLPVTAPRLSRPNCACGASGSTSTKATNWSWLRATPARWPTVPLARPDVQHGIERHARQAGGVVEGGNTHALAAAPTALSRRPVLARRARPEPDARSNSAWVCTPGHRPADQHHPDVGEAWQQEVKDLLDVVRRPQ